MCGDSKHSWEGHTPVSGRLVFTSQGEAGQGLGCRVHTQGASAFSATVRMETSLKQIQGNADSCILRVLRCSPVVMSDAVHEEKLQN